jgi:sulfotransferase family protein
VIGRRAAQSDPVFIHGILFRSGTNFLFQLLGLHPDLAPGRDQVFEDRFLEHSDALFQFVESVRSTSGLSEDIADELLVSIGDGLLSFLVSDPRKRLLVKNPRVRHLDRFFSLFPAARLVVLLRDGRSVVQSGIASFGWELADGARRWAAAADEIAEFGRTTTDRSRFLVVRHEDLIADLRPQMERILDFCGLKRRKFDFEQAARLPVHGSSEFFGSERRPSNWRPVERDEDFDPRHRWREWSSAMHEEFWAIAGAQMHTLGYSEEEQPARSGS